MNAVISARGRVLSSQQVRFSEAPIRLANHTRCAPTTERISVNTNPATGDVKEYRTQVQILSEQIAQMKKAQDSMKTNQETLQQTHARELLELRLQPTTADRDRLQREHDLEQELKQQQLEMIDRM